MDRCRALALHPCWLDRRSMVVHLPRVTQQSPFHLVWRGMRRVNSHSILCTYQSLERFSLPWCRRMGQLDIATNGPSPWRLRGRIFNCHNSLLPAAFPRSHPYGVAVASRSTANSTRSLFSVRLRSDRQHQRRLLGMREQGSAPSPLRERAGVRVMRSAPLEAKTAAVRESNRQRY